jgi:hypothetical protein
MYTTCLFCHSDLGANEVIEHFPVGRRLAYDAVKGRLWVVCRKCERWNLTPVDERWEAIEEAERLFSTTRLKASTDNIGMARLREGLELVRIGQPQRPEFAAWRYGDQFGRRRVRYLAYSAVGVGVVLGGFAALKFAGLAIGGGYGTWQMLNASRKILVNRSQRAKMLLPGETKPRLFRHRQIQRVSIDVVGDRWGLRIPYNDAPFGAGKTTEVVLMDQEALRAASTLLPAINARGGNKNDVQQAVRHIEATPDVNELFQRAARVSEASRRYSGGRRKRGRAGSISKLPGATALALEMAAHEDIERRAMEGELAILEAAWRQAEEIAGIADNLLLPADVDQEFESMSAADAAKG